MATALERLTYESTTGSTGSLLNLATILAESHRANVRDGLTGALAAHRDRYFQIVEGPGSALDALLLRLARDPRHKTIRILDRRRVHDRLFSQWSMASPTLTPPVEARLDGLLGAEIDADRVLQILQDALALPTG
ncbi:hypothetical protein BH09PSE1_BH09PSE1_23180 [soil metagenome]